MSQEPQRPRAEPEFLRTVAAGFAPTQELDALVAEAVRVFDGLVDEIPYLDRPGHVMYGSAVGVYRLLALFLAARERGYSAHQVGSAVLETLSGREAPSDGPQPLPEGALARLRADAEDSQRGAAANEFVFEFVLGDAPETAWGINILSCAVCHAYAKHDAMDLVPYMCATDDVASDAAQQGLRRTGTLALSAHRCDFRYKLGGEPLPLAPQYPDRIRFDTRRRRD